MVLTRTYQPLYERILALFLALAIRVFLFGQ